MAENYVLKYHPVGSDGQRSIEPTLQGSKYFSGSALMYHIAKLFCARKRDFIVETSRKKGISKGSTAVTSSQNRKSNKLSEEKVNNAPEKVIERSDVDATDATNATNATPTYQSDGYALSSQATESVSSPTEVM